MNNEHTNLNFYDSYTTHNLQGFTPNTFKPKSVTRVSYKRRTGVDVGTPLSELPTPFLSIMNDKLSYQRFDHKEVCNSSYLKYLQK